jgi:hypothetical protein
MIYHVTHVVCCLKNDCTARSIIYHVTHVVCCLKNDCTARSIIYHATHVFSRMTVLQGVSYITWHMLSVVSRMTVLQGVSYITWHSWCMKPNLYDSPCTLAPPPPFLDFSVIFLFCKSESWFLILVLNRSSLIIEFLDLRKFSFCDIQKTSCFFFQNFWSQVTVKIFGFYDGFIS